MKSSWHVIDHAQSRIAHSERTARLLRGPSEYEIGFSVVVPFKRGDDRRYF